jgi:predicted PurR-regulated permease PerM
MSDITASRRQPAAAALGWPSSGAVLTFAVVVLALHFGQAIFIPLALAMVLSVALIPLAARAQRLGLGRVPAVLIVVAIAVAAIGGFALLLASQAMSLAAALPEYETTLRARLHTISDGSSVFTPALRTIQRLTEEIAPRDTGTAQAVLAMPAPQGPLATLMEVAHYIVPPIASLAIGLLFMAWLMLSREDVRDRFLHLAGAHDLSRTTQALADATDRIGRYLLMQVVVNTLFGSGMALGLLAIGVPSALLWGLIGFVLRFVPYLGAPLSVLFPLLLAFATADSFAQPLLVLLLFAVVDGLCSYVLEPALYGHSIGISPLALLVSSGLWTVVWGPIGLLLAPPITACLVTIGRHVPQLAFLDVLFGDTQPLPPARRFHHRLLADDRLAAEAVADEMLDEHGQAGLINDLVMPTLATLRDDMARGALSHTTVERIGDDLSTILDEYAAADPAEASQSDAVRLVPVGNVLDRPLARAACLALREAGVPAVVAAAPAAGRITVWCATGIASAARLARLAARSRDSGAQLRLLPWGRGVTAPAIGLVHDLQDLAVHLKQQRSTLETTGPTAKAA